MPKKTKEKFEFGVEIKKILKLMIHSLYTNKDVAVRELISNASDACDKLRYKSNLDDSILGDDKELKIQIEIDEKNRTLSIIDNGIGMDRSELISQLGTIAKSGTENFLKNLSNDDDKNMQLIGQFGVGFYSAFMIGDKVTVISRKAGRKNANIWESKGEGNYTIEPTKEDYPRGTKVTIHLKKDEDKFLDKFHIKHVVKVYSDHIDVPVELAMGTDGLKTINTSAALWTRPKKEITKEQYQQFYKHISHMPGEPYMILHNKAEGLIEFTNLLFIPDRRPFDLFHPDRMVRIKLYVKKVFITEDAIALLPRYLRFVQGIVDSSDLPLNISRESLQYNNMVEKIKRALTKRILNELRKKAEKDPEGYRKFWENFGSTVKEGLCESDVNKEDLLKVCKFHSSKSVDKSISLDEYVDRMKPEQDFIYYITGNSIANIENSPQVEGFKSKGIEVLYLVDTVDDFWVTVTTQYKDKRFKSITRTDIDLEDISDEDKKKPKTEEEIKFNEDKKDKEKNKKKDVTDSKYDGLLTLMKSVLEGKVKDIKLSKKLTNSPVCLVADANAMDIRLERYLLEQKQLAKGMLKILEINPNHKIIKSLNTKLGKEKELENLKQTIKILYDEACVLEGEPVANPSEFAKRLNEMLQEKL